MQFSQPSSNPFSSHFTDKFFADYECSSPLSNELDSNDDSGSSDELVFGSPISGSFDQTLIDLNLAKEDLEYFKGTLNKSETTTMMSSEENLQQTIIAIKKNKKSPRTTKTATKKTTTRKSAIKRPREHVQEFGVLPDPKKFVGNRAHLSDLICLDMFDKKIDKTPYTGMLLWKADVAFSTDCNPHLIANLKNPFLQYYVGNITKNGLEYSPFGTTLFVKEQSKFICNLPFKSKKCFINGRPISIIATLFDGDVEVETISYQNYVYVFEGQKYRDWKKVAAQSGKRANPLIFHCKYIIRA